MARLIRITTPVCQWTGCKVQARMKLVNDIGILCGRYCHIHAHQALKEFEARILG